MTMIQKALEFLSQPKRETVIKTELGSMLWHEPDRVYKTIINKLDRKICCVESLAAAVIEEGVRRNNEVGDHMTVIFNRSGAEFHPDDKIRRDQWTYKRVDSQQYEALKALLSGSKNHVNSLRRIQALRPSIDGADALLRQMRKVQITTGTKVVSAPLCREDDTNTGGSIEWTTAAEGGPTTKTKIPAGFQVKLPIVRGSEKLYTFDVEIEAFLGGDEKNTVAFSFTAPELDQIIDQAVADEFAWFKAQTMTKMPRLLVLLDY